MNILKIPSYKPNDESEVIFQIADGIRASFSKKDYTLKDVEDVSRAFEIAFAVTAREAKQNSSK